MSLSLALRRRHATLEKLRLREEKKIATLSLFIPTVARPGLKLGQVLPTEADRGDILICKEFATRS